MGRLTSRIVPGDWNSVAHAIARLDARLNTDSAPIFSSVSLTGLTENALMYADGDGVLTSLSAATNGQLVIGSTDTTPSVAALTGTASQVIVTPGAGSITLSTPQNIHAAATPTFADLTLSSPSNIYALSHDSFADFVATEHLDHALTQDANLINWWRMDDITGSTVTDLGSGSDDGTLIADATQAIGVLGKGVTFDGTGDYINLPSYTVIDTLTNFSVCFWFRVDEQPFTSHHPLFCIGGIGNRVPFIFGVNGTSTIRAQYGSGGEAFVDYTLPTADVWHHLVFTFNRGANKTFLYIDGVEVDDSATIAPISGDGTGYIGRFTSPDNYLQGDVDDVRVYDRTLNQPDVVELYELGTLDAMTTFNAAYFTEYIASRSGFFNTLHVSDTMTDVTMTGLTVTGGRNIAINASNLTGTGDILPQTDGNENLGSVANTFSELHISDNIFLDTGGIVGISGGPTILFNAGQSICTFNQGVQVAGLLLVNTDTFFVDAVNDKVGIGTTLPDEKLEVVGNALITSGKGFIGPTASMLAPLNITGDTADIGDRHEGLWMRSKVAAWIVQLNVRGPRLEIGGGASLDTTPAMSVDYNTGEVGIGTTTPSLPLSVLEKSGRTAIGGSAVKLTNKTGGNTVAGQLVAPYSATAVDDAFKIAAANSDEVFGIVLDAGIADGSEAWIVVSGIADVLMDAGGSARGDRIISSATAGSADVWNVGGAVATHFLEIGHCIETRAGAGLARCILHFN